ncbi:MAG: aminomethyl-transferring glycine dehydrogenase subunit GcvPB, partial [Planctomycetota bacterium]
MTKLIFEQSKPGRQGCSLPLSDVPAQDIKKLIPDKYRRATPPELPEADELTVVRHYTNLSKKNMGVDDSFYPLGSCTMKYNPKINETLAALNGFSRLHPYQPEETAQGILEILYHLGEYLKEISGLAEVTLQPAAGAHGEFTGLKLIRAYLHSRGNPRKYVLIPDSAHGTNPASVVFCGYEPVEIKSDDCGNIDLNDLKSKLNPETAAMMITIPNTLGLFDENLKEISDLLHKNGSFLYMDGANLNALMGLARPADFGVDVLHFNLHKTFATPHGGGGPGSGPVAACNKLAPYLPVPLIKKHSRQPVTRREQTTPITDHRLPITYTLDYNRPQSIGRIKGFYGNVGVALRAYIYIRMLGAAGLKKSTEMAVLNANYIAARLKQYYRLACAATARNDSPPILHRGINSVPTQSGESRPNRDPRRCMHECVLTGEWQLKKSGVKTLDIAKRLLDYGFHPPTIYFPLIVHEALMIEPTETESKETL